MVQGQSNTARELEPDAEPSMEEILASIRQIIADDDMDAAPDRREDYTHPENPSNSNELDDELEAAMQAQLDASLAEEEQSQTAAAKPELTIEERAARIRAEFSAATATPGLAAPAPASGKLAMEALAEQTAATPAPAAKPAAPFAGIPLQPAAPQPKAAPLQTPSFASAQSALPPTAPVAESVAAILLREKGAELEATIAEAMRPAVRTWLADNLPGLVERLVREEIENVSRGRAAAR